MLRTFVLALHDNAGRNMGNADGRVGFVDVLAAGAAGAKGVDAQVFFVHIDINGVVDFRVDEHRGKRGVATFVGIKREMRTRRCTPASAFR